MNKDMTPYNNKYQEHGLWERYKTNGSLYYKGYYVNGKRVGLWVWYYICHKSWDKQHYNHLGNIEGIVIN